jgi:hypothetical protein
MSTAVLSPALCRLIDALAEQAAADYLTEQTALQRDSGPNRLDQVQLPGLDEAA